MAEFEIIPDTPRGDSSGTRTGGFLGKMKKFLTKRNIILFGGGAVVLFLLLRSRSAAGVATADETDGELVISGYPIAPEEATATTNQTDLQAQMQATLDQFQSIMDERITAAQNETMEAAAANTASQVANVTASANKQIAAAGAASSAAIAAANKQVSDYQSKVESTIRSSTESLTKQNAALNTQIKAGYGDNGAGWSAQGEKDLNQKLQNSSFKNSEIDRAKAVIANREAAGMDTSLQKKYLNQLQTTGKVG
jgi:hypothetical protein